MVPLKVITRPAYPLDFKKSLRNCWVLRDSVKIIAFWNAPIFSISAKPISRALRSTRVLVSMPILRAQLMYCESCSISALSFCLSTLIDSSSDPAASETDSTFSPFSASSSNSSPISSSSIMRSARLASTLAWLRIPMSLSRMTSSVPANA